MRSFFPLPRREAAALVFLIAFAAFAFIPAWRHIEVGGMAVFGWLIAALMLISPAVTLVVFMRRSGAGDRGAHGGGDGDGDGDVNPPAGKRDGAADPP